MLGLLLALATRVPAASYLVVREGHPLIYGWAHEAAGASIELTDLLALADAPPPVAPARDPIAKSPPDAVGKPAEPTPPMAPEDGVALWQGVRHNFSLVRYVLGVIAWSKTSDSS